MEVFVGILAFFAICFTIVFIIGLFQLFHIIFFIVIPLAYNIIKETDRAIVNVGAFALGYYIPLWVHLLISPIYVVWFIIIYAKKLIFKISSPSEEKVEYAYTKKGEAKITFDETDVQGNTHTPFSKNKWNSHKQWLKSSNSI